MAVLTIILAPIVAFALRWGGNRTCASLSRIAAYTFAALSASILCAGWAGLRWTDWRDNLACGLIVYCGYCLLAVRCLAWKRVALRRIVFALACLPMIVADLYAVLPFSFGLDAMQMGEAPLRVESIGSCYTCEWRSWGLAISDGGDDVTLYRNFEAIPYLHRKLAERMYSDDDRTHGSEAVHCGDLLYDYEGGRFFNFMRSTSLGSRGANEHR